MSLGKELKPGEMGVTAGCRKRLVVKGRVQGVGFRFHVIRLASGYDVTGFVRNQPDGSVEVVDCSSATGS